MQLRDYQEKLKNDIYAAWQSGARNVLAVAPTGAGKTAIKGKIFAENNVPSCAIAHRQELVSQISNALAEFGVFHRIIAPKAIISFCISEHIKKFRRSFHHPNAMIAVAGIDTLLRRTEELTQWLNQVRIWDIDEAHHVLAVNKWGKGVQLFPNALGVGFTATPVRCDRKALGRTKSGVFDVLAEGPTMRELIDRGYLADYIIYGPPQSIDTSTIAVSDATGEFNQDQLRKAAHRSTITGDIVEHYLRIAAGKLGITFTVDVEIAVDTAKAYRAKGVPAEAVSAKTPDVVRSSLIDKFRRGELKQLVNVDLFGEGMDVPAVEVVSMGRPTQSEGLYKQQFGRAMRTADGKTHGTVIDHVGNVKRHGLPDRPRVWSLDDQERGRRKKRLDDAIPVTTCVACFRAYEAVTNRCPYCGHKPEPASRGAPEFVDGDLVEYSPELLAQMRGEIARIDGQAQVPYGASPLVVAGVKKEWAERQEAQQALRDCISLWAGVQREVYDRSDSESYRRFYHMFGVDVMTAQTLGKPEAEKLTSMIRETFT